VPVSLGVRSRRQPKRLPRLATKLKPLCRPNEPLASRMAGYIVSFAVVAGFSNALWLLMFGVNEQRWREQAKAAGQ